MTPARKERLTDWVRTRPAIATGVLALVLVVVIVVAIAGVAHLNGRGAATTGTSTGQHPQGTTTAHQAGTTAAGWAPATTPPLLPGETLWHGVPSMLWGTNDTQNFDQQHNLITEPAIQQETKADHLALIRTWLFQYDDLTNQPETDDYQQSKVQAAINTGAPLLCVLATGNSMAYDEHLVTLFKGQCAYYEFMNEPDYENVTPQTYASEWGSEIPRLRAIDPHALFGGPTAAPTNSQCSTENGATVCFMQKVLKLMAQTNVKPDFISFHWYPCWVDTATSCMQKASTFADETKAVRGWLVQDFGAAGAQFPLGVTEWNANPASPPPDYTKDTCWVEQFTVAALKSMAGAGIAFANQYDLANYGGYGADDMVDIQQNGAAKPQYLAMVRLFDSASPYGTLPMPPLAFSQPSSCPGVP